MRTVVIDAKALAPLPVAALGGAALIGAFPVAGALLACPLRALTGLPCPLCGGTTSVVLALQGHAVRALETSPLGVAAVAAALVLAVVRPRAFRIPLSAVVGMLAAGWAFQLHRFGLI